MAEPKASVFPVDRSLENCATAQRFGAFGNFILDFKADAHAKPIAFFRSQAA